MESLVQDLLVSAALAHVERLRAEDTEPGDAAWLEDARVIDAFLTFVVERMRQRGALRACS